MKSHLLKYCITFFLLAAVSRTNAQFVGSASATGHVFAEVVSAFSAIETSQLNFGRFSPGPDGGEIILTPQGTISVLGSVSRSGGIHNAASFYLSGPNATFSITLPGSVVLTNTADAKTMRLKNWVSVPSSGLAGGNIQDGSQTVYIGATLEVGPLAVNPVGIYTGSYSVTFDFN